MGAWLTRTRAWVYVAFYDEYVGRHINLSAGLSIFFFIPLYMYGIQLNRICENNAGHWLYNLQLVILRQAQASATVDAWATD